MKKIMFFLLVLCLLFSVILSVGAGGKKEEGKAAKPTEIRMAWWGATRRHGLYNAILDLYEKKNPNIKMVREYANWDDYWSRLQTQAAGGNPPDVCGMVMMTIREYVDKKVIIPLDDYVKSGVIDLSDWKKAYIDTGTVNGKLYSLSMGETVHAGFVNKSLLEKSGFAPIKYDPTWEEYYDYCKSLAKKLPEGYYATSDGSYFEHIIEHYARSIGKELYSSDGKDLGFTEKDMVWFFEYWDRMRKEGICPDAAVRAEQAQLSRENQLFTIGKQGLFFMNSNQLKRYQVFNKEDTFELIRAPSWKGQHGEFLQPSALSITTNSKVKDEAVKLINWFVNDLEATKIFNAELGVPAPKHVVEMLMPNLMREDKLVFEHMDILTEDTPPTIARAVGSDAVIKAYWRACDAISFGQKSIEQSVKDFFGEARTYLNK